MARWTRGAKQIHVTLSPEEHKAFKVFCVQHDTNMTKVVEYLVALVQKRPDLLNSS